MCTYFFLFALYTCYPFLKTQKYFKGICGSIFYKLSRDLTRPLRQSRGLKGLFHGLNATMIPIKVS